MPDNRNFDNRGGGNNNRQNNYNNNRQNNNRGGGNNRNQPRKFVKHPDPMGDTQSMGRFAMKLIRDIARGKLDFKVDAQYFLNDEFINIAIREVGRKIAKIDLYIKAINYAYASNMNDALVQSVLNENVRSMMAYTMVYNVLGKIAVTKDLQFIGILTNNLFRYKHDL